MLNWLQELAWWLLYLIIDFVKEHPGQAAIIVGVIFRLFGTTVQTGWKGVLFRFGRVDRELDPGFHFLIPFVDRVRKTPIRSITLHLPMQRIATADGLVFDVQANLVYRIVDPKKALVQIDDVRKGCETVLPLVVQELLAGRTRDQLQDRKGLDEELTVRAEIRLSRWGATVEQAGFMTIAPTSKTLRLTQLRQLTLERQGVMGGYLTEGLSPETAVALLGTDRRAVAHSTARYRARSREGPAYQKAFLKAFLASERQRLIQEYVKLGHSHAAAVTLVDADPTWMEHAARVARIVSRGSRRRRQITSFSVSRMEEGGATLEIGGISIRL